MTAVARRRFLGVRRHSQLWVETGPTNQRVWRGLDIALLGVLFIVVVYLGLVVVLGASVLPVPTDADTRADRIDAVKAAARAEVSAVYSFDYRGIDANIQRALTGATGNFRRDFQQSAAVLKSAATGGKVTSAATITELGVGPVSATDALVLVAVDTTVRSTTTEGRAEQAQCPSGAQCGRLRLQLRLTQSAGVWLVSALDEVR